MNKLVNESARSEGVVWWHWHRRLYDWVIHFADTRYSVVALFILSFAESSFFPIPPDVLLAPVALGSPRKWVRFATICSVGSVVGGVAGYAIGMFLWYLVGGFFHQHVPGFSWDMVSLRDGTKIQCVIDPDSVQTEGFLLNVRTEPVYPISLQTSDGRRMTVAAEDVSDIEINAFTIVGSQYKLYNWQIVAFAGFTPFPYKVVTITAGIFRIHFIIFIIASLLSRSARFFMVAGLMGWKGEAIKPVIDKYFNWFSLAFVALLVGGFLVIKWVH